MTLNDAPSISFPLECHSALADRRKPTRCFYPRSENHGPHNNNLRPTILFTAGVHVVRALSFQKRPAGQSTRREAIAPP